MKKFSKLFWVALVVVAVLACTAIGVFAAETVSTAVVYGEVVEATESFSVDFSFKNNNTKVECGKITLTWDSELMTAETIVKADALDGAQFGFNIENENGKAVIAWAGSAITDETAEGKLFTVSFANTGIADTGYATVDVAVDNFGYTEGFVAKELKSTVQANSAFATGAVFDTMTYDDTTDETPEAFLEDALGLAADGNVTVKLGKDMVFTTNTLVGTYLAAPMANKITIESAEFEADGTTPKYDLVVEVGAAVTLYGTFEFKNVGLWANYPSTVKNSKGEDVAPDWDRSGGTGFLFPDNASGTFVENIYTPADTYMDGETEKSYKRMVNLAGNVTVNTGSYTYIAGNFAHALGYALDKDGVAQEVEAPAIAGATIIAQGDAVVRNIFGGGMEAGAVTEKSTIKVLGNAKVTDELVGGARYSGNNGSSGADILINTTNKIYMLTVGSLGSYTKAAEFNLYMLNGEVSILSGVRMNAGGTTGKAVVRDAEGNVTEEGTVVNMYIDGGTISQSYPGFRAHGAGGATKAYGETNLYLNIRKTGEDKPAIYGDAEYPAEKAKIGVFYGGSRVVQPGSEDAINKNIEIAYGEFSQFFGGSFFTQNDTIHSGSTNIVIHDGVFSGTRFGSRTTYVDDNNENPYSTGCEHTGAITVTIHGGTFNDNVYGGSTLYADAVHGGTTDVTIHGGTFNYTIIGGSDIKGEDAKMTAKSKLTLQPTEGKTITAISKNNYHIAGGSSVGKGVHEAASELVFKNLYSAAYGGKTVNFVTATSGSNRHSVGGSSISGTGSHVGSSSFVIEDCILTSAPVLAGGSRVDGVATSHVGNSTLTIDAEDGFGWYQNNIYGGSYVNGYTTSNNSTSNHIGESHLYIKAPKTNGAVTTITGANTTAKVNNANAVFTAQQLVFFCDVWGGSYYEGYNVSTQQSNSSATVSGSGDLIYVGGAVYGGSRYQANRGLNLRDANDTSIVNKITVDTISWPGTIYAGYQWNVTHKWTDADADKVVDEAEVDLNNSSPEQADMKVDLGIIYLNGGKASTFYLSPRGSVGRQYSGGPFFVTNTGTMLFEINAGTATTIQDMILSWNCQYNNGYSGTKVIKLISTKNGSSSFVDGGTADATVGNDDTGFNVYTKVKFDYYDMTHCAHGTVSVSKIKSDGTIEKNSKGSVVAGYAITSTERILDNVYFDFLDADGNAVTPSYNQSVEDFLATEGLKVHYLRLNADGVTPASYTGERTLNYSILTMVDHMSTMPNAFRFFKLDENNTEITNFTESAKYRVQLGDYTYRRGYANMTVPEKPLLNVTFRNNCSFGNNFSLLYAVAQTELEGYSNIRLVVEKDVYQGNDLTGTREIELTPVDYTMGSTLYHRFDLTGIVARQLGDGVRAVLKAEKDGVVYESAVHEYSLITYVTNKLTSAKETNEFKRVLVDALNYCAAAQIRNSYRTDALVNEIEALTPELKALSTGEYAELVKNETTTTLEEGKTVPTIRKNVKFGNSIEAIFAPDLSAYDSLEGIVIRVEYSDKNGTPYVKDIESKDFVEDATVGYYGSISSLKASELRTVLTVKVLHNGVQVSDTITYSIETYAAKKIESTKETEEFKNLLKAMMVYSDSAKAYFG